MKHTVNIWFRWELHFEIDSGMALPRIVSVNRERKRALHHSGIQYVFQAAENGANQEYLLKIASSFISAALQNRITYLRWFTSVCLTHREREGANTGQVSIIFTSINADKLLCVCECGSTQRINDIQVPVDCVPLRRQQQIIITESAATTEKIDEEKAMAKLWYAEQIYFFDFIAIVVSSHGDRNTRAHDNDDRETDRKTW